MGLKEWLLPRDGFFYDCLRQSMDNASATADELVKMLENPADAVKHREAIKQLEHKGDESTHRLFDALATSFITPLDREDLGALAKAIDNVTDAAYAASNRLVLYEIRQPPPPALKFARLLQAQCHVLRGCVEALRESGSMKTLGPQLVEVHRLENQADRALNDAVAELFKTSDPVTIIKHKDVYEILEGATDRCEDVADVISDIMRKHA